MNVQTLFYYDEIRGRSRLKRRYRYASVGFAIGLAVGLILGVLL